MSFFLDEIVPNIASEEKAWEYLNKLKVYTSKLNLAMHNPDFDSKIIHREI